MRRRIALVARVALALSMVAGAAPAAAQESEDPSRRQIEGAREHMELGQELYVQGRYIEAAEEFQRAYEMQPFGAFLYNAAVAYEHEREWTRAADFFARYIERDPEAGDASAVQQRIERLRTLALQEGGAAPAGEGGTGEGGTGEGATGEGATGEGGTGEGATGEGGTGEGATGEGATGEGGTGEGATGEGGTGEGGTGRPHVEEPEMSAPGELAQDMKSLLAIRTNPEGAQVTLRQAERVVAAGPAPFAHTLGEGEYRVVVEHPDYRTVEERVRIRPGKVYVVIVEMSQGQFLGYLRVVTDIPGASVFIDDREEGAVGETPFQNVIGTGEHTVWIDKPGYRTEERQVEVGLGEDVTMRLNLTRVEHGRIRVVANVRGAKVFVDDRRVGTVPYEGEVGAGPRRVRVEADDMKDYEETVDVRQGQVTPVRVRLRPAVGRGGAWVTASLATLLVAGGAVMGVLSNGIADDLAAERDDGRLASDDPRFTEGQILSIAADAAFGLGAILGGLAIFYFLRDPLPDSEGTVLEPRDWAFDPHISPDGAGGSFRWSF